MGTATTSESTPEQGRLTPKLSRDLDNARARAAEGVVGAPFAEDLARELPGASPSNSRDGSGSKRRDHRTRSDPRPPVIQIAA